MDRALLWGMAASLVVAVLAGGWRWGWLRGPMIVLLAAVAVASSLVTLFFLYGGFAWTSRGGGTLLLFVLPAAVLAWVAFAVLRVVWRSRSDSRPVLG
ncbi:MAG: hypothetical protein KA196_08270 [Arenimonas sp.]|nr:hypothetical protein [Arenimonas sp.]